MAEEDPMDDSELFAAAMASDTPAEEAPVEEAPVAEGRQRDEKGRFVKQEQEVPAAQEPPPQEPAPQASPDPDGQVPSWRLRELREERDALASRNKEFERELASFRYQSSELQRRLEQLTAPAAPNVLEDPEGHFRHGVREAVDPVRSEINQVREFFSHKEAVREHGAEAVQAAHNAIRDGLVNGNPEVRAVYNYAMQSMDPYGVVMKWHNQQSLVSKIGNDPDAWFQKTLDERLKDQAFSAKVLERLRGTAPSADADGTPNIKLPPSLNKVTGAKVAASDPDDGDMSDRGLFRYASRGR